jgi:hypothetical protein
MTLKFRNHFPKDWSEEKISKCVSQIVNEHNVVHVRITGKSDWIPRMRRKFILDSYYCGLNIRVILEPEGRGVLAAYPYIPEQKTAADDERYPCPCCGFLTMIGPTRGTHDICPVCGWEDDKFQYDDPDCDGRANTVSLNEARSNYAKIGAAKKWSLPDVRPPRPYEVPPKEEGFKGPR